MAKGPSAGIKGLLRTIGTESTGGGLFIKADGSVNGTGMQTWEFGAVASAVVVSRNAGVIADFRWATAGVVRWVARVNGDAEAGSNSGSNFEFMSRDDAGVLIGMAYSINRATRQFDFKVAPTVNGAAIGGGAASGDAITKSIVQTAHGFSVGMPISRNAGAWVKADRDAATTMADAVVSSLSGATGDPFYASVVLLLHGDGANAATTTTDNSGTPKTMTAGGNAQLSTAIKKFGTASMLFDGSGDYFSTPNHVDFNFGTGDFTVECWVYLTATGDDCLISNYQNTTNGWTLQMASGKFVFNQTGDAPDLTGISNPVINTWYHVAVSRIANVSRLFVGGVLEASFTNTDNITSTQVLQVGQLPGYSSTCLFGYLDDVRITKNVGRYAAAFTPPSTAFLNVFGTESEFTYTEFGHIVLATGEWDLRTGDAGGLVDGEFYWLSSTAGGLTRTAPTTGLRQLVMKATSATTALVMIGEVLDLGAASGGAGGSCGATPYTYTQPAFATVSALLHFNGSNLSTTITDQVAGNAWTCYGSAALSTTWSALGTASLKVPSGGNSSIGMPTNSGFNVGSGAWTLRFRWKYLGAPEAFARIFHTMDGDVLPGIALDVNSSSQLLLYMSTNGTSGDILNGTVIGTMSQTTDNAVLVERYIEASGLHFIICAINGTVISKTSLPTSAVYYNSANKVIIGGNAASGPSRSMNAYLDEFEFNKGVAALVPFPDYTIETVEFPNS